MLYQKLKDFVGKPTAVDAGYKTPFIAKLLLEEQVRPVMTYQRPMTTRTTSREGISNMFPIPRFSKTVSFLPNVHKVDSIRKKSIIISRRIA